MVSVSFSSAAENFLVMQFYFVAHIPSRITVLLLFLSFLAAVLSEDPNPSLNIVHHGCEGPLG